MAMRLNDGIFLAPFHPLDEDPTLCIQRDLELIDHLDRLGYEEAWVGEHHSGGFEIIASPEVFIAAAAERTKRIRLGTGVVSLPYHNPLTTANRILQLDHQTRGRVMFGVEPGLLPSDAFQMGISPETTRDRMVEGVEVMLRLFAGERVTHRSDWFNLVDATCQLKPYTWPHPEIAVASSITPSGGKLAGKHGFGLLCVAATHASGYDALGVNWKIANDVAAANGKVIDPARLRLVGPVHIAPTREEAWANVQYGGRQFADYFSRISRPGQQVDTSVDPIRKMVDDGAAVVGTPDDAIAQIRRLQEKQGEFGVFLQLAHNWADFDKTKKSYELWRRHVSPAINRANDMRQDSFDWATGHAPEFIKAAMDAAASTISRHNAATA
ncbi:LLM class flavin-dependent oxidoreductase [Sphingomonas sp. SUN019]|uniref:LLM class flavin-dependent oxidoreductase n=1 Tax=Sphingomonas sp. SUN019 TaxID=2937788 RepID=UPI002164688B|nr:LLM class flavin-dependent oxidoreductase [Sphingomonas sp. SUN019]UVO50889.1 LLM class flavin-dependent oxidoreductase [Sphingomonas sp. SUN019]